MTAVAKQSKRYKIHNSLQAAAAAAKENEAGIPLCASVRRIIFLLLLFPRGRAAFVRKQLFEKKLFEKIVRKIVVRKKVVRKNSCSKNHDLDYVAIFFCF
jgi:hypothetical protein